MSDRKEVLILWCTLCDTEVKFLSKEDFMAAFHEKEHAVHWYCVNCIRKSRFDEEDFDNPFSLLGVNDEDEDYEDY